MYYRPKRYCPVLVAQEGSALWGNTLTTALLHDLNRTIPFGTVVLKVGNLGSLLSKCHPCPESIFFSHPSPAHEASRKESKNAYFARGLLGNKTYRSYASSRTAYTPHPLCGAVSSPPVFKSVCSEVSQVSVDGWRQK